jgi:hypothetical protein
MRKIFHYLAFTASVVTPWLMFSDEVSAQTGRLHLIIAIDSTSPDIADDMRSNLYLCNSSIREHVPRERLTTTIISDGTLSQQNVLVKIQELDVLPDDAVAFYYSGHGFYEAGGRGTFITPRADQGARFYRSTVEQAIQARQPRLSVVIFDCCSVVPSGPLALPAPGDPNVMTTKTSPLFESLFFEAKGSITLVSSSPGEYALCHVPFFEQGKTNPSYLYGSLFTGELISLLGGRSKERLTWEDFCPALRQNVSRKFKKIASDGAVTLNGGRLLEQTNQTVVARIDGNPF